MLLIGPKEFSVAVYCGSGGKYAGRKMTHLQFPPIVWFPVVTFRPNGRTFQLLMEGLLLEQERKKLPERIQ